jgi:NADH dehydrogenase FAD-containing subunit
MPKVNKEVVIIGGSFAGYSILELLVDYCNVTLIDRKDHFEHVMINMKYFTDEYDFDSLTCSFETLQKTFNNKFKFI